MNSLTTLAKKSKKVTKPTPHKYNSFNWTRAAAVTKKVARGMSLAQIEKQKNMPSAETVRNWYRKVPEFKDLMDIAVVDRADHYVDDILDTLTKAENGDIDLGVAKLKIDTLWKIVQKLHPKYAEERAQNLTVNTQGGEGNFQIILAPPSIVGDRQSKKIGADHGMRKEETHVEGEIVEGQEEEGE